MHIGFEIPEGILHDLLDPVTIPRMARVCHDEPTCAPIQDAGLEVRRQLERTEIRDTVQPGQRIAVAVGSRGIARLPEIVAALVDTLKTIGAVPFIVPAMGSHGGATAEGQRAVLYHLGVTEDRVGAPIESQMATEVVGYTPEGEPVQVDALALRADGIVVVARVKPHTAFRGPYESGLAKMIAIGLGKQGGAATTHARGFGQMARQVPQRAEIALAATPIRFGLAILENARDEPFKILAVPADRIMAEEPELLDEARRAMPHLPFDRFDVLLIDKIGKDISGDGADPNITGRYPTPDASGGPIVNKQVVLDLTDAADGNANGIGTADYTTVRAARKVRFANTYPNALTSTVPGAVKLPMVLPSDRLALAAGLLTCHAVGRPATVVRIADTMHLRDLWISESLLDAAACNSGVTLVAPPVDLPFDADGNLPL